MALCSGCGSINDDNAQACSVCGQSLVAGQPSSSGSTASSADSYAPPTPENPRLGYDRAGAPPPAYQSGPLAPGYVYQSPPGVTEPTTGPLAMISMVMGIVVLCFAFIGLVPCLGWLNWVTVTFGPITITICVIGIILEKNQNIRNKAIVGLALALVAVIIGAIRLVLGGGCL